MDSQDVESSEPKSDSKSSRERGTKRFLRKKQSKDASEDPKTESGDFLLFIFHLIINHYDLNHHSMYSLYINVLQIF